MGNAWPAFGGTIVGFFLSSLAIAIERCLYMLDAWTVGVRSKSEEKRGGDRGVCRNDGSDG